MKEHSNNRPIHKFFQKQNETNSIKVNIQEHKNNSKQSIEDIPFTLTFGKEDKKFFNQLFSTNPAKIHSKKTIPVKQQQFKETIQDSLMSNRSHSNFKIRHCINNDQLQHIKQKLSKITYSIKTIESRHDQQMGISSKRVLMGNKQLQTQKIKLTSEKSQRNHCKSSLGFRMISQFQYQNDQNLETARFKQPQQTVHRNKFSSKRLNVLIRRKSLVGKQKDKQTYPKEHFIFFEPNLSTLSKDQSNKQNKQNDLTNNKISIRKQKTLKQKLQNKKLKYDQYLMKKQAKVLGQRVQNAQQQLFKIVLPQQNNQNHAEKKRKLSLSNFISHYNTQNMQNYEDIILQKKSISKPLKQIFKNKFSTISKIAQDENPSNMQKVVFKMRKRKHSILTKKQNKQNNYYIRNELKDSKIFFNNNQFKRYNEIDKQNFYL